MTYGNFNNLSRIIRIKSCILYSVISLKKRIVAAPHVSRNEMRHATEITKIWFAERLSN